MNSLTSEKDIIQTLKSIFSDVLSKESLPIEDRTRLNCLHWDSLNHLKIVAAIEQEFNITLSDDEVYDLNSFELAVDILKTKNA